MKQKGWLFSLRADRSNWGDYDQFHAEIICDLPSNPKGTLDIPLGWTFGTTFSSEYRLEVGDGIGIFHNRRAQFPKNNPLQRLPRISLIGEIVEVQQSARSVETVRMKTSKADYVSLLETPYAWDDEHAGVFESIFDRTRQVAWWPVKPNDWAKIKKYVSKNAPSTPKEIDAAWVKWRKHYLD